MLRQSSSGLGKNFQTQSILEGSEFIKSKKRDNEGAVSALGQPPDKTRSSQQFLWVSSQFSGEGNGNSLQYSCLEKSHGQRSLVGCSPWGCEESDTTERLHFHFSLSCIEEGNGNPLQCSCLENPRDGGAWWAAVYGVAQSRTRLQ